MQLGYIGEAEWCPEAAEAMPSSQGDARAADRARTQGGGGQTPMNVCVLRWQFGDYVF
jgi:hypothetical protein